jgi:Sugar (and other) transporter
MAWTLRYISCIVLGAILMIPSAFQAIWPILFAVFLRWMPESPRWLVLHGKNDQALAILERLHSTKSDPEHSFARGEFWQIQKQTELDQKFSTSWLSMITKPSYRKRSLIALSTTIFIASSGILVAANKDALPYASFPLTYDFQIISR